MDIYTQIIDDLNVILSLINNTQKNYAFSAEITRSTKLQNLFTTYAIRRMLYAAELKTIIDSCGGRPAEQPRITDTFYSTWVNFKRVLIGKNDDDIIDPLIAEDMLLLKKYNQCIKQQQHQIANMGLLIKHRNSILEALNEMNTIGELVS
jgi:uncharacterized protein (TIGR02284 family)